MTDEHQHPLCVRSAVTLEPSGDAARVRDLQRQLEIERSLRLAAEAEVQRLMCWTVGAYVDGEMDQERADAFRLPTCKTCPSEVVHLQQIAARLESLRENPR